ncbi:MAG: class I SAM-dependent methyltransferase [Chitinophagales bacterium]
MVNKEILAAYEKMAVKYSELIENKPHNAYYDRPNTLQLLGDVNGKVVLDAACGPGKYAEILLAQGATVTGFDFSPKMIELAKQRNGTQGTFYVHDLSLPFSTIADSSQDVVLCALALHYLKNWNDTIREFHRVLKKDGQLVISIEHPFFEYNYFQSKAYFNVEQVKCTWRGFGAPVDVPSYRRPLQECMLPLTENGFYIDRLVEPLPTAEFEKADPKHFKELNEFPSFLCIRAVRR